MNAIELVPTDGEGEPVLAEQVAANPKPAPSAQDSPSADDAPVQPGVSGGQKWKVDFDKTVYNCSTPDDPFSETCMDENKPDLKLPKAVQGSVEANLPYLNYGEVNPVQFEIKPLVLRVAEPVEITHVEA